MFEAWSRKHMNRIQFLELFDFIETASKGTTFKKRTMKKVEALFVGKVPKRHLKQSETSLKPSLSIHLSISLSLSLNHVYLSYIYIYTYVCMGCIGSLSDPFPLALNQNVNRMWRSVNNTKFISKTSLYKLRSGPTNQNCQK